MRRLIPALIVQLLAVGGFAATGVGQAAADTSRCLPGETVHVDAYYSPRVLRPGETGTNVIEVTNCTNETQQVTYSGEVTAPGRCGGTSFPFGPVSLTLAPGESASKEVPFEAPDCGGSYRQVVRVYQDSTVLARDVATFTAVPGS
jgi:uncharacterized protein YfaS (alpha-2-macroglobulin family)